MKRWILAIVLIAGACTSSSGSPATEFTLSDFDIVANGGTLPQGTSVLSVRNTGEFGHTLVVSDESGRVVSATDLIPPGEFAELPIEVTDGRYEFACRIVFQTGDGMLIDHYEAGMQATLEVTS